MAKLIADPVYQIYDSVAGTATTTSSALALPIDSSNRDAYQLLAVVNSGAVAVRVKLGTSGSVTATGQSFAVNPYTMIYLRRGRNTHCAVITDTGSTAVTIGVGEQA